MVPALNEEKNIENTVKEIKKGINSKLDNYEILIFDDGSKDNTGMIAENLKRKDKKIKVIHNHPNKGMGYNYIQGVKLANFEYYLLVPGDNGVRNKAIRKLTSKLGSADIILAFHANQRIRPKFRQIISQLYTFILNSLFGFNLKYFNGVSIHRTDLLRNSLPKTYGFAFLPDILVHLLKGGASYLEVDINIHDTRGFTSAFKFKNIVSVVKTISTLFWELEILRKPPLTKKAKELLAKT